MPEAAGTGAGLAAGRASGRASGRGSGAGSGSRAEASTGPASIAGGCQRWRRGVTLGAASVPGSRPTASATMEAGRSGWVMTMRRVSPGRDSPAP